MLRDCVCIWYYTTMAGHLTPLLLEKNTLLAFFDLLLHDCPTQPPATTRPEMTTLVDHTALYEDNSKETPLAANS
jgi:hypothetical protein